MILFALAVACGFASDWLSSAGDPQGTRWQRHGKQIDTGNAKDLKLLWEKAVAASLSSPVIIGPTITHRGIRELVFVAAGDDLYAFDADLGGLFWKRQFDASGVACKAHVSTTPVIEPDRHDDLSGNPVRKEESDDEASNMRPLYVVASDGMLHNVRMSDGSDGNAPVSFLPSNAVASSLNFGNKSVYAAVAAGCGAAEGIWSINVKQAQAKPEFVADRHVDRVVLSAGGSVFAGNDKMVIRYEDREFLISVAANGHIRMEDADLGGEIRGRLSGLASWQDGKGIRWIFAATDKEIRGFQLSERRLKLIWAHDGASGPPVIANGVIFAITGNTLTALDSANGHELFSNRLEYPAALASLAVANGHVCFTNSTGLACFGIPIER